MFSFLNAIDIVVMVIGCTLLVVWLMIFFGSSKYNNLFENLQEKEYPLKDIYSTGYWVMEKISYQYKGKFDRKLRADLSILYEEKYVDYYLRVVYSQAVTFTMIVFLCGFILYGLSSEILILIICIVVAGVIGYYFLTLSEKKIKARSEELLTDFSEIVSKLALLVSAGMILKDAWFEVAYAGEGTLYSEMQIACEDMSNGISEPEAIRKFGVRCIVPEIKKFSSTIIQGIEKGNSELTIMLQNQSDEVWEEKKQRVKRSGAKANTKLMIPMMIMFVGVLIMIIVPIFANLGV